MMRETCEFRPFPTSPRLRKMNEPPEVCRWVYFRTVAVAQDCSRTEFCVAVSKLRGQDTSLVDGIKTDLAVLHAQLFQKVCAHIDLAFQAFFRRVQAGEAQGYPRFEEGFATKTIPTSKADSSFSKAGGSTFRIFASLQRRFCPHALAMQAATHLNCATILYSATGKQKQGDVCHETNRL